MASATSVERTRFSVNTLRERDRFEAWRASIACVFDVEPRPRGGAARPFEATLRVLRFGEVMIALTETRSQAWHRSPQAIARDGMDHYMIQTYSRGSQRVEWKDGAILMPQHGLMVYDLSQPMWSQSTDLANLSLVVPRAALEPLLAAPDGHHMRALEGGAPFVRELRDHMAMIYRELDGDDALAPSGLAGALVELVAACLNAASGAAEEHDSAYEPALWRRAHRMIEAHLLRGGFDPESLPRALEVSPERVQELFMPFGGVGTYMRSRRLNLALRLMSQPLITAASIAAIAERFGFTLDEIDQAFRRRYRVGPLENACGAWRGGEVDCRYERWLHDLGAEAAAR